MKFNEFLSGILSQSVNGDSSKILPVRCAHCRKVRYSLYGDWTVEPARQAEEVEGLCRSCLEDRRARLSMSQLERGQPRRVATGKLRTAELPEDPFKGFRGE